MAYLRQILHLIHLSCFAFILGNMINDYIFGKRRYEKSQYPLLGRVYTFAWLGMIVTGIWQIMAISFQHNYVKNKKYMTWIKLLLFKTVFALISAYGLELFVKIFVPSNYKKIILNYLRISCFLILFVISGIVREYRETQLRKKDNKQVNKETEINKKNN